MVTAESEAARAEIAVPAPPATGPLGGVFRNAFALALGRNLNALGRLVVAGMIVRGLGAESFGVYSMVVALLAIADWILDFGTTDVFVRETVSRPERYESVRRSLVALKVIQAPIAMLVMLALLLSMRYSREAVLGGVIAAASIGFFAGVAVYRSLFKATLTMEREMVAEFVSVLALIPLVALAIRFDFGIAGLMWALFASRAVFLAGCIVLAPGERTLSLTGGRVSEAVWLARSSVTIGVIGLLIVVNNSIEILLLSGLGRLSDVAYFSAAQKLVWPVFMALTAFGAPYYPLLAARYSTDKEAFHRGCQQALDVTVVTGGLAVAGFFSGAEFLVSLLGPDMLPAAGALRLLVVMCAVKAISAVIGPTLYIVNGQRLAFCYFSVGLAVKAAAIYWAAPLYGFFGTACVTLAAEVLLITPITLYFVRRLTGFRPRFGSVGATLGIAIVSIASATLLLPSSALPRALVAGAVYCALVVAFRVIDFRALAHRKG